MPEVLVDTSQPPVAILTLNRPNRLNALSHTLVRELHEALRGLREQRSCRAVILTGADRAFCSGFDLKGAGEPPGSEGLTEPERGMLEQQHIAELIPELRSLPQPVIAAVNGPAVGGGMALALGADIRLAATSAHFSVANIKVGLSGCDVGISYLLPRIVGAGRAFELMLTGRKIDAEEAERYGLVSRVLENEELMDGALSLAQALARNSRFGVWMTKEVMWSNLEVTSLRAAIDLEDRTQILATFTGDMEEAKDAFREGRAPRFSGAGE